MMYEDTFYVASLVTPLSLQNLALFKAVVSEVIHVFNEQLESIAISDKRKVVEYRDGIVVS